MKSYLINTPCWVINLHISPHSDIHVDIHGRLHCIDLKVQGFDFYTGLVAHIFLFHVIKAYLKVILVFFVLFCFVAQISC